MSGASNCEEVLREVEFFLDRELPRARWVEIQEHIEICGPCAERVEFRRRLRALVARKCRTDDVPHSLRARIRSILDDESHIV